MTLARPIRTVSRIQIPAGYRIRLQLPAVARYHLKTHTCITTEPNSLEVNRPFTRDRNGPITTAVGLKPPAHQCPKGNSGGKDLRVGKSWGCPVWSTGATQSGAASGFNWTERPKKGGAQKIHWRASSPRSQDQRDRLLADFAPISLDVLGRGACF
jgi:hypothetical protein